MKKRGRRISIVMKRSCDLCVTVRCLREGDPADLTLSLKKKKKIFSSSLSPPLLFTLPKLPLLYFESCTKWKKVLSPPSPIYAGGKEGKDFFFSDPSSSGPPPPSLRNGWLYSFDLKWSYLWLFNPPPFKKRRGRDGKEKEGFSCRHTEMYLVWYFFCVTWKLLARRKTHFLFSRKEKKKTRRRWWIFSLYNQLKMNKFVLFLLFVCGCW